ncbi:MAG TPA: ABC transporter permease [Longimicrobium sp.]|jgi:predicted permease
MDTFLHDLRYALRQLARSPGFTLLAVVTLALGIGANTALFTLVDALLFRPRPGVADPDRLVWVTPVDERGGHPLSLSYPDFRDYQGGARDVLSDVAAFHDVEVSLSGGGEPETVRGQLVSGGYFAVLGTPMALGRGFAAGEDAPGSEPVAVLSHALWRRRFGADPRIVGRRVVMNGLAATVVGVTAPGFNGADHDLPREVWLPMSLAERALPGLPGTSGFREARTTWWLNAIGRLKPGVTPERADAALAVVAAQIEAADPEGHKGVTARTFPAGSGLTPGALGSVVPVTAVAFAVTGLVLLIACANVSNLLLARAAARRREIGVRLSLGAGRGRIVRQLLTESVLLAALACAAGLVAAAWGLDALAASVTLPPLDLSPDLRVLAFCAAAAGATGVLFGLVPALDATRADVVEALKDGAAGPDPRRARLQGRFVAAQVALSLVLLAASGLFLRSLAAEARVDVGYDASDRVLAVSFDLGRQGYSDARARAFTDALAARAEGLPGVRGVAFATSVPMGGRREGAEVFPGARPAREGEEHGLEALLYTVGPDYLRTVGIPLARGRGFAPQDAPGAPPVAVVSEALARQAWPGADPLGRELRVNDGVVTVVGVAREAVLSAVYESAKPAVYLPLAQRPGQKHLALLVGTAGDARPLAAALRREVRALDPDLPVEEVRTLAGYRRQSMSDIRATSRMIGLFGALALLLAAAGIYGVMAFAVTQRTREIGVRIALGARRGDVVSLFVRRGVRLALMGIAVGLVLAAGVGRLMAGVLYGLSPVEAPALAAVAALLAGVAALAAYFPARRAARVDPVVALKAE